MKVILLDNIAHVGQRWEVHDVADGYARNVLIPKGLAEPATQNRIKHAQEARNASLAKQEEDLRAMQELASALDGFEVTIRTRANSTGNLYAAVTARQIVDALAKEGHRIPLKAIHMSEPVKHIGEYPVTVSLDHGLEIQLHVIVEAALEDTTIQKTETS